MSEEPLSIGALARITGSKVQTIRYYEDAGLLPHPVRSRGNQRLYLAADAARLKFIRHCRDLGFSLDAVRDLLRLADHPEQPCEVADQIARGHLVDVELRIDRLRALQTELQRMIAACNGRGRVADCRIIHSLSDHGLCAAEHPPARAAGTRLNR